MNFVEIKESQAQRHDLNVSHVGGWNAKVGLHGVKKINIFFTSSKQDEGPLVFLSVCRAHGGRLSEVGQRLFLGF